MKEGYCFWGESWCILLEKVGIKNFKNTRAIIDYSQTIDNIYENLEDYNPPKKTKLLIAFNDVIVDF